MLPFVGLGVALFGAVGAMLGISRTRGRRHRDEHRTDASAALSPVASLGPQRLLRAWLPSWFSPLTTFRVASVRRRPALVMRSPTGCPLGCAVVGIAIGARLLLHGG